MKRDEVEDKEIKVPCSKIMQALDPLAIEF